MTSTLRALLPLTLLPLTIAGCGGNDTGDVRFTVWGEEFIEQGIPAGEVADDFEIRFDRFLVVIGDLRARNGEDEFGAPATYLLDLVNPGPHEITTASLRNGDWSEFQYSILPIGEETLLHTSATVEDRAHMEAGPYGVSVAGQAIRGEEAHTFSWDFSGSTLYADCVQIDAGRERPGFGVGVGGLETLELTIHGDHFFYDDLAADDAALRFEAMATADADRDGDVTLAELAAVSLVDLPAHRYGTGNFSDVNDLGAFVSALVTTLGHFNGEGHCVPR